MTLAREANDWQIPESADAELWLAVLVDCYCSFVFVFIDELADIVDDLVVFSLEFHSKILQLSNQVFLTFLLNKQLLPSIWPLNIMLQVYVQQQQLYNLTNMQPFQVYARIRPLNDRQHNLTAGSTSLTQIDDNLLAIADSETRETYFQMDQVFNQTIDNVYIFDSVVKPLIGNFLSGINSTVFAYGITGAGKSYTMFGKHSENIWQPGLIELSLKYLCEQLHGIENTKLSLSYLQIYNEQVFDLLKQNSQSLQIQDDPVLGVVVNDLQEIEIQSSKAARSLIELGNTRRVVAETKANEFSSRSHAIVQIGIERTLEDTVYTAKMSFVDLAGSERQHVYGEQKGIRNLQGSNINRSLLTLGNCITLLSEKRKGTFIPYRDSKLTRLLKQSLGGNTKTAMIACVSPSILSYDQTLNTLKYACRAKKIEKNVHKNIREPRSNDQLKREVLRLRKELEQKDDKKATKFTRKEMQDFIENLIRNVQALTVIRCGDSYELSAKMREIELIEEQRKLIGSVLGQFNEEKEERPLVRCNSTEAGLGAKNRRLPKSVSDRQLLVLKNIQNEGICNIPQSKEESEGSESMKNISFVRGNLQNVRLRYQQQRKNMREIITQYHYNMSNQAVEKAQRMLLKDQSQKNILSNEDRRVLNKIVSLQSLTNADILQYNLNDQCSQNIDSSHHSEFKIKETSARQPRNRFQSSLEEIRRMMKRITGNVSVVQEQEMFLDESETYEQTECARHLSFE